jgi:hypothetical protein
MNGDVPAVLFDDGTISSIPFTRALAYWKTGGGMGGSAGIYTWDGNSAKRGRKSNHSLSVNRSTIT